MPEIVNAFVALSILVIILIMRMIALERVVKKKVDIGFINHISENTKKEVIDNVSGMLPEAIIPLGGIFAYEIFKERKCLVDALLEFHGPNHEIVVNSLRGLIEMIEEIEGDIKGDNMIFSDVTDILPIEEIERLKDHYQEIFDNL